MDFRPLGNDVASGAPRCPTDTAELALPAVMVSPSNHEGGLSPRGPLANSPAACVE